MLFEEFLIKVTKTLSFMSKKCFSYQNERHVATIHLSAVLKHF